MKNILKISAVVSMFLFFNSGLAVWIVWSFANPNVVANSSSSIWAGQIISISTFWGYDFDSDPIIAATISDLANDWNQVKKFLTACGKTNSGCVWSSNLKLQFALDSNKMYWISYVTQLWSFWNATIKVWNPPNAVNNRVVVSPTITMNIENNSVDFWSISHTKNNESLWTKVLVTTNAPWGYILSAKANDVFKFWNYFLPFVPANLNVKWTEWFSMYVSKIIWISDIWSNWTISIEPAFNWSNSSWVIWTWSDVALARSNGTSWNWWIEIKYKANVSWITPPWNYSTKIIFRTMWNF